MLSNLMWNFRFAVLAAQYYAPPDLTGKPFGSPEMLTAMWRVTHSSPVLA
jgi:hypothetical protein